MDRRLLIGKSDAILDAALELFTQKTYASTTVPEIAANAGVAAGTIYLYFAGKDGLANAVYQREKRAMAAAIAPQDGELSVRDEIDGCWRALWTLFDTRPSGVLFLETQQHAQYLNEESRAVAAEVDQLAIDLISRGQLASEIRPGPPAAIVAMVFGAFVGLAKTRPPRDSTFLDLTSNAIWNLLTAKGAR